MGRPGVSETVSVLRDDLDVLLVACLKYLPDNPDPGIPAAFSRLNDARHEAPADSAPDPEPVPPGRYGRVEIPGYRENEGWISEETRFGQQVAVVRDREGCETAAIGIGPLCRVVWLPVPGLHPEPLAITSGGDDEDLDDRTWGEGPF